MSERIFKELLPVDPELERLLELARNASPMTPEEREAQRRSFAYGNCAIENPAVTREMVDEVADGLSIDPELVEALARLKDEIVAATGADPEVFHSAHLGHYRGPVHPKILKYERPK